MFEFINELLPDELMIKKERLSGAGDDIRTKLEDIFSESAEVYSIGDKISKHLWSLQDYFYLYFKNHNIIVRIHEADEYDEGYDNLWISADAFYKQAVLETDFYANYKNKYYEKDLQDFLEKLLKEIRSKQYA